MAAAAGSIGLGSSLAGGILSAFSAEKEGQSQSQMYSYQAQVARINAQIDRQNSEWALHKGDVEGRQYGMKAGQQFGQIRAAQGASGLDVNSGSANEVQQSQRAITHMDEAQIRENSGKTAYDYRFKATTDENQATLYDKASSDAESAGHLKALGSLIGTAGSVSSKWMAGAQAGMWGGSSSSIKLFGPNQTVTGYA
jgi:hypothetical protein